MHPKIVRIHKPADLEDSSKPVEDFFIRFDAFGNRFHAKLSRNRGLLATNADSFVIGSNGIILNAENIPGGHFHGKINDQDDSFVSLSHGHLLVRSESQSIIICTMFKFYLYRVGVAPSAF